MSIKIIPSQQLYICDRCKAEGSRDETGPFYNGAIHIKKAELWSRNWEGMSAGNTESWDFCTKCYEDFFKWLKGKKCDKQE